jgi:hypothetical protein
MLIRVVGIGARIDLFFCLVIYWRVSIDLSYTNFKMIRCCCFARMRYRQLSRNATRSQYWCVCVCVSAYECLRSSKWRIFMKVGASDFLQNFA